MFDKTYNSIEKACKEIYRKYGQFELRNKKTKRALEVVHFIEKIADKHGLKRDHLHKVYFGIK
jgi:hypothetical protein